MVTSNPVKIWLDDTRAAPSGWTLTKTVADTTRALSTGRVQELSLDYDLDATDPGHKGIEVLTWLERALSIGLPAPVIHLHTANPWGAAAMTWKIRRLEEHMGQQPISRRARNIAPDRFNRVPGGLPDGDVELARRLLESGAILLDVRSPEEYASGHLQGAVNIPHDQIQHSLPLLRQLTSGHAEWAIIVYCVWGIRGANAKIDLMRLGFPNVLNVGGLDGLLGRPLARSGAAA